MITRWFSRYAVNLIWTYRYLKSNPRIGWWVRGQLSITNVTRDVGPLLRRARAQPATGHGFQSIVKKLTKKKFPSVRRLKNILNNMLRILIRFDLMQPAFFSNVGCSNIWSEMIIILRTSNSFLWRRQLTKNDCPNSISRHRIERKKERPIWSTTEHSSEST